MCGNDPQCRAPNSGRRKVWSIEGIKQRLHSDSINYDINIPKPIKFANSDSSPFNSNEALSDDTSSPDYQNLSRNDFFQNSSNTNPPSNTTSPFKQILEAPDNHYSVRTQHPSQN